MPGPPNVKHAHHYLPVNENGPFANQKKTSIQGGNRGLTVFLLAVLPKSPLGGAHRICVMVAWSGLPLGHWHTQQYSKIRIHTLVKRA